MCVASLSACCGRQHKPPGRPQSRLETVLESVLMPMSAHVADLRSSRLSAVSPLSAQALYEAGYITYMRTDRPTLSKEAAGVAERAVRESFGDEYVRKGERLMRQ